MCLDLVRLLHFLSHSPLGSVALLDFQPRQFVTVSGELKLTDLDDASVEEPVCQTDADCTLQFPLRNFTLPCSARGVCAGLNEKRNLYNAYRYTVIVLLHHSCRMDGWIDRLSNGYMDDCLNIGNTETSSVADCMGGWMDGWSESDGMRYECSFIGKGGF